MKRLSFCLSAVFLLPVNASAEVISLGAGTTVVTEISREGRITGSYYSRSRVQTKDIIRKQAKPVFAGSVTIEPAKKAVKKVAVKPAKAVAVVKMPPMPVQESVPAMVKPSQGVLPKVDVVNDMPMQATDSDMRQPAKSAPAADHAPRGSHEEGSHRPAHVSGEEMERRMHR